MSEDAPRESPSIHAGVAALSVFGFLLLVALSIVGLRVFYDALARNAGYVPPQRFAGPGLVVTTDDVRDSGIAAQRADLERYRWVDRQQGIVQTPIERAMAIVAARGAEAYAPIPAPKASP